MIIRVFRAYVHDGKQDEFREFFAKTALPHLRKQAGMLSATIGWPMPSTPNEFLMITQWKDMESLKGFAGDDWDQAVIHPSERHLLFKTIVHHYESADG